MATLLKVTCPRCNWSWEVDYEQLQAQQPLYKSVVTTARREEYIVRCPNPHHSEDVVLTIQVEE